MQQNISLKDNKNKVSIVMPFFHKFTEFEFAIKYNIKYFKKNNVELVIVIDHPCDNNQLLKVTNPISNLNYKILVNPKDHNWRNPAITINAGIKASSGQFIIVMSPESIFLNDGIKILTEKCIDNSFSVGEIQFMHHEEFISGIEDKNKPNKYKKKLYYGSICFRKNDILKVGGYNESLTEWGGDDDNIRLRLIKAKLKKILTNANLVHLETKIELYNRWEKRLKNKKSSNTKPHLIIGETKSIDELGKGFELRTINYQSTNCCQTFNQGGIKKGSLSK